MTKDIKIELSEETIRKLFELLKSNNKEDAELFAKDSGISNKKLQDLKTIYFWGWAEHD